jgi:hypothetical protein
VQLRVFSAAALPLLVLGLAGQSLSAAEMTAFELLKVGDKVVSPKAQDRITRICSEKSTNGLVPDIWHIDYFDPTTAFKRTEVTFVAGKVTKIEQPKHFLDSLRGSKQLSWRKLKIDSDRALALALKDPMLKNLHLQAAQFWLEGTAIGSSWQIRFWAFRRSQPDQIVEIGDLYLSSKTGEILRDELHTEKAN